MAQFEYTLDEHVAVLTMNDGENRFNYDFLQNFMDILDEIEQKTTASVLVATSSHQKIWSNGIDLEWLVGHVQKNGPGEAKRFPLTIMKLLRRILTYPMITIASINGHAFAGGAIMACAFDFRFMRSDRGFFCIPEVDIGIPLMPGMDALFKKAVPLYKFNEMQFTGKRLTAQECAEHHIAMKACHIDQLPSEVMAYAKTQNKRRDMLARMKAVTFKEIIRVIDEDDPVYVETQETGLKA
ncbi:MAG: enoyl-CoA hydratase/isomerase family protein [Pseudomonadota bacterium]